MEFNWASYIMYLENCMWHEVTKVLNFFTAEDKKHKYNSNSKLWIWNIKNIIVEVTDFLLAIKLLFNLQSYSKTFFLLIIFIENK